MKKLLLILLALTMCISMCACGGDDDTLVEDDSVAEQSSEISDGSESGDIESNDVESNDAESNDAESNDAESNDVESNDVESNDAESNDAESDDAEPDMPTVSESDDNVADECKHEYKVSNNKKATCTENGKNTYKCTKCAEEYSETVPAEGHDWKKATCASLETCASCGTTRGKLAEHNYVNDKCSVCGDKKVWTYKNGGDDYIIKTDGKTEKRISIDMSMFDIPKDDPDGYFVIETEVERTNFQCIDGWVYFNQGLSYYNKYIKDPSDGNYAGISGGHSMAFRIREDGTQCEELQIDWIAGYNGNTVYFYERDFMMPDYGKLCSMDISKGLQNGINNKKVLISSFNLVPTSSYYDGGVIYCKYDGEDPMTCEPVADWKINVSDYE